MTRAPVRVELHCHSNLSDGAASPETLAAAIAGARVSFAALTDHDTTEGCGRFRDALSGTGVACIDGVEITAISGRDEVHLLGYGIDPSHPALRPALAANRLRIDAGMPGLVDSLKRVRSRSQRSGAAPMEAADAISLVHAVGGRAFLAHPLSGPLGRDALLRELPALAAAGLDGLEAVYGPYPEEDRRWLEGVAAMHRLVVSGGSDFHGPELVAGPDPGVELTGAEWKAFRDLLLPGRRPVDRPRGARDARRPGLGRFAARIVLPAALAVALFVVALFAVAIPRFERVLLERKKDMIRELANEATSILREYAAEQGAGRLSAAEARRGAAARIRDLRYGKDNKDYFWITDMRPVMIVHPYRPELEGTDVSEYRDANGVQVFVEFVKAVRDRNQGYVEYLWQWKDDAHRIVPKLSFVERFPAWDWVVGTGIYLDDVHAEIVGMARWMIWLSLGITAALALLLAFLTHESLAIERGRQTAEARLRESHERYRALVEASGEGMVLLVDGAFAYANHTFLDMTGYSASQLPLVGVTELILPHEGDEPARERIVAAVADAAAPAEYAAARGRLPDLVQRLLESGAGPRVVHRAITEVSDLAAARLISSAAEELGGPPVPFAFIVFGSAGRKEMTLGSDQDNAIVYADGEPEHPDAVRAWFHELGVRVCGRLAEAGVPACPGGMIAANPRWCAPLAEWKRSFAGWISEGEPRELLDFQICFDFRPVYGDRGLAAALRTFVADHLAGEPPFFLHLARDALQHRLPPLFEGGILRDILRAGSSLLDTKDAAIPFVSFARLYALRHGVAATSTLERLDGLRERGVLKSAFNADLAGAFAFLAGARLARQAAAMRAGKNADNLLDTRKLDREAGATLGHAARQAALIQKRISFDFLGSAL